MAYIINLATLVCIYGILGISLNLSVGEAGLLNVAQAAFYGIGAYATALLMVNAGLSFFLAALVGMAVAGVVAIFIGVVFARLHEVYWAFATIGFCVIVYSIFLNWQSITNGPLGIPGIVRPALFGIQFFNNTSFLILTALALLCTYGVSFFVTRSSFGRVLHAIREDEQVVSVFGYRVSYYKLMIFAVGAMLAALAGSFYASYVSFIDPTSFDLFESILILAVVILGGLGSARGAMLGALLLIVVPELLRFVGLPDAIAAESRQTLYGLVLIFLMLYRPQGLLGEFRL